MTPSRGIRVDTAPHDAQLLGRKVARRVFSAIPPLKRKVFSELGNK